MNGQSHTPHDFGNVDRFELRILNNATFNECPFRINPPKHHLKGIRQIGDHPRTLRRVPADLSPLYSGRLRPNDRLLDTALPIARCIIEVQTESLLVKLNRLGVIAHVVMALPHHGPITNRIQKTAGAHFKRTVGSRTEFTQGVLVIRLVVFEKQIVILLLR